jgi:hypothetical protein
MALRGVADAADWAVAGLAVLHAPNGLWSDRGWFFDIAEIDHSPRGSTRWTGKNRPKQENMENIRT